MISNLPDYSKLLYMIVKIYEGSENRGDRGGERERDMLVNCLIEMAGSETTLPKLEF